MGQIRTDIQNFSKNKRYYNTRLEITVTKFQALNSELLEQVILTF